MKKHSKENLKRFEANTEKLDAFFYLLSHSDLVLKDSSQIMDSDKFTFSHKNKPELTLLTIKRTKTKIIYKKNLVMSFSVESTFFLNHYIKLLNEKNSIRELYDFANAVSKDGQIRLKSKKIKDFFLG